MVHVMARVILKPEAAQAGRDIMVRLAAASRLEAGCLSYEVFQRPDAPHVFQTVERWRDQAAADAHMSTAHVGEAIAAAGPLFAAPPEILAYTQIS